MQNRYRIYTERKNIQKSIALALCYFQGFTLFNSIGVWEGTQENSMVFEIIDGNVFADTTVHPVYLFAQALKSLNEQQAVFVTREKVLTETI